MIKVVYIHQCSEIKNGQSIFDARIIQCLKNDTRLELTPLQFDINKNEIVENTDYQSIDQFDTIIILSHFNTFRLSKKFNRSKLVFINHDLPYHAYLLDKSFLNYVKAIYLFAYIKFFWRYSNFHFFLSKEEMKTLKTSISKSAQLKVGIPPVLNYPISFNCFSKTVLFTGNYNWSLKIQSLHKVFKNGYSGKLNLTSVNADENFAKIAAFYKIPMLHQQKHELTNEVAIGVITDTFVSGFKLKILELISLGCCICTFADILNEFSEIPFHDIFIKKIDALNDIDHYYDYLIKDRTLIKKYSAFYERVVSGYNWENSSKHLVSIITEL